MKYRYWVSVEIIGPGFKGAASNEFVTGDRPLRASDMPKIVKQFLDSGQLPLGSQVVVSSIFKFEDVSEKTEPSVSVAAIEDLIVRSKYSNGQAIIEGLRRLIAGAR